jgi:hypothetical protein
MTRALLLLCLLTSAIYAGDLQDLVSASNDFEVEMIEHEHVSERNLGIRAACSELYSQSTFWSRKFR